jgi:hypothetical protein
VRQFVLSAEMRWRERNGKTVKILERIRPAGPQPRYHCIHARRVELVYPDARHRLFIVPGLAA